MTPYINIMNAQLYFNERLNTGSWDNASDEDKDKALLMSTRAIDKLNFVGDKTDSSQELQFPRGGDDVIPTAIEEACCELALTLLDDVDIGMEIEDIRILRHQFANVRNTYNGDIAPEYVVAGIPSAVAWQLLLPYLRNTQSATITRAN